MQRSVGDGAPIKELAFKACLESDGYASIPTVQSNRPAQAEAPGQMHPLPILCQLLFHQCFNSALLSAVSSLSFFSHSGHGRRKKEQWRLTELGTTTNLLPEATGSVGLLDGAGWQPTGSVQSLFYQKIVWPCGRTLEFNSVPQMREMVSC